MTPFLLAALLSLPLQDDDLEKLKARVKELEAERDRLRAELELSRQDCFESAKEIFELRQQIKSAEPKTADKPPETVKKSEGTGTTTVEVGPDEPIRGRVMFIDKEQGFLLLNIGKKEGVKVGYRFEIVREVKEQGKRELTTRHLAVGEVLKLVGAEENHSKVKIVEGDLLSVQLEDEAIAYRKTKTGDAEPTKEGSNTRKAFKVSGRTNDVYLLNYSGLDGAKPATLVYAYRDKKFIAKLRIDKVEKDYSIARIVEGTQSAEIKEGDTVEMQEVRILVVGRLKYVHRSRGIFLNIGAEEGAKVGMRMQVTRSGKRIGEVVLDSVERYWSTARISGETQVDELKENDFVEEIP